MQIQGSGRGWLDTPVGCKSVVNQRHSDTINTAPHISSLCKELVSEPLPPWPSFSFTTNTEEFSSSLTNVQKGLSRLEKNQSAEIRYDPWEAKNLWRDVRRSKREKGSKIFDQQTSLKLSSWSRILKMWGHLAFISGPLNSSSGYAGIELSTSLRGTYSKYSKICELVPLKVVESTPMWSQLLLV